MQRIFQKRWVTVFVASLWLSAALLHGFAPTLSAFIFKPKNEVAAQAIDMTGAHRQGTCHHHPQGCPSDCLCPKTGFVGEEVSESHPEPGLQGAPVAARLMETSWVECSESRAASSPTFVVYLAEPTREISVFEISEALVIPPPASARAGLRAPPTKIPIV